MIEMMSILKRAIKLALNRMKRCRFVLEEQGQGTIEYILVLIVAVTIILGGLYQLNSAFRVFADNYFGDYLACLLETGELPSMGGGNGPTTSECNQSYKPFSLADGRPQVGSGVGGDEGEFSNDGSKDGKKSAAGAGNPSSGSTIVANVGDSSMGGRGGSTRFRASKAGGAGDEGSEDKDGAYTGSGAVTNLSGYESGSVVRIPLRSSEKIRGSAADEEEKQKEKKTKVSEQNMATLKKTGPQLIKVERKLASESKSGDIEEFTFGKMFRMLIIIAIIIAIIIFIGGQIMQVSKSME